MSLYGGMTYPGTPFIFDKIYKNKKDADEGLTKDGILIGRYIYVQDNKTIYRKTFDPDKNVFTYEEITDLTVSGEAVSFWHTF